MTVVKARTHDEARHLAARSFSAGKRHWRTPNKVKVKRASRADVALWELLLAQDKAGAAGARVDVIDHGSQEALFDVA